jgi:prepilin-type N-terminal cleavage/methylation domain-containing protein
MFPPRTKQERYARGFTLVEVLVSLAIFAIVMTITVGALVSLIDANRRAQSLQEAVNNLNFALESMGRQIRVGDTYRCVSKSTATSTGIDVNVDQTNNCQFGKPYLAFEPYDGVRGDPSDQHVFKWISATSTGSTGYIAQSTDGGDTFQRITAPNINVENLLFFVEGAARGAGDGEQPRVIMVTSGSVGTTQRTRVPFNLQTTVTQRLLDY